jgi:putative ATP-binding cassette transporter
MLNFKNIGLLILYAIINTLLSFGVLSIINKGISGYYSIHKSGIHIVFFSFVIFLYLLNVGFQKIIIKGTYNYIYSSEVAIVKKLQDTSLLQIQQLGSKRIYGILEDLRMFVFFPNILTSTINSILLVILCVCYLFIISFKTTLITIILLASIAFIHIFIGKNTRKKLNKIRRNNDIFNGYIGDIIEGFKELKISSVRRENLFKKFVKPNRNYGKKLDIEVANTFLGINILSQYGLYAILGGILFLIPMLVGDLETKQITSFVVILLFMAGPINRLVAMQGTYARLTVAFKRVSKFFKDFEVLGTPITSNHNAVQKEFQSLEFKNTCFSYSEDTFSVGPINLKIKQGETIFIIGGNGSGKSTYINLLTGLLQPTAGEVLLNNKVIQNNDSIYQKLISVIFTNNYLFSENYENYALEGNKEYDKLLKLMKLEHVVKSDDDKAARRNFSKGESKRMSMIFALLEHHPILVLDEWAADQDPYFRKYFYEEFIPILKEQGKTLIMVTHDDTYFKHADRIIKFNYGKIEEDIITKENNSDRLVLWNN